MSDILLGTSLYGGHNLPSAPIGIGLTNPWTASPYIRSGDPAKNYKKLCKELRSHLKRKQDQFDTETFQIFNTISLSYISDILFKV